MEARGWRHVGEARGWRHVGEARGWRHVGEAWGWRHGDGGMWVRHGGEAWGWRHRGQGGMLCENYAQVFTYSFSYSALLFYLSLAILCRPLRLNATVKKKSLPHCKSSSYFTFLCHCMLGIS